MRQALIYIFVANHFCSFAEAFFSPEIPADLILFIA